MFDNARLWLTNAGILGRVLTTQRSGVNERKWVARTTTDLTNSARRVRAPRACAVSEWPNSQLHRRHVAIRTGTEWVSSAIQPWRTTPPGKVGPDEGSWAMEASAPFGTVWRCEATVLKWGRATLHDLRLSLGFHSQRRANCLRARVDKPDRCFLEFGSVQTSLRSHFGIESLAFLVNKNHSSASLLHKFSSFKFSSIM